MKIYDRVKLLLETKPYLRDSDKELLWHILTDYINPWETRGVITRTHWLKAPSFESVTRARRKIQEHYPALRGSTYVEEKRREKERDKGTFIYREEMKTPTQPRLEDF